MKLETTERIEIGIQLYNRLNEPQNKFIELRKIFKVNEKRQRAKRVR